MKKEIKNSLVAIILGIAIIIGFLSGVYLGLHRQMSSVNFILLLGGLPSLLIPLCILADKKRK
ncbi:hypothetical protein STRDD10_00671 [Streptococcus sp. DD10]|uniref:hypothetical protein n=1 Tax=Streptococcus sp. DD10 TaxID=1777878 RepID=UPI0007920B04|nr:hypothetical protein [Streptococcus sp. DD10]KXT74831.1 hypothetical protein STRDD10_00671 [Streptococcus sp. DD10]